MCAYTTTAWLIVHSLKIKVSYLVMLWKMKDENKSTKIYFIDSVMKTLVFRKKF